MRALNESEYDFVTGGLMKGPPSEPFWDRLVDWVRDVFMPQHGGGGSSLSYDQAVRACHDVGITAAMAGAADGTRYTKEGGKAGAQGCEAAVHIIQQHQQKMENAIECESEGNAPGCNPKH